MLSTTVPSRTAYPFCDHLNTLAVYTDSKGGGGRFGYLSEYKQQLPESLELPGCANWTDADRSSNLTSLPHSGGILLQRSTPGDSPSGADEQKASTVSVVAENECGTIHQQQKVLNLCVQDAGTVAEKVQLPSVEKRNKKMMAGQAITPLRASRLQLSVGGAYFECTGSGKLEMRLGHTLAVFRTLVLFHEATNGHTHLQVD